MKKITLSLMSAFLAASAVVTGTVALSTPAYAQAAAKAKVDAAKTAGIVGEQSDGYLGFVKPGDATLKAAVDEINSGRAGVYAQAASQNGVSPAAAGASAFNNIIMPRLKSGEFYKDTSGNWKQK